MSDFIIHKGCLCEIKAAEGAGPAANALARACHRMQ